MADVTLRGEARELDLRDEFRLDPGALAVASAPALLIRKFPEGRRVAAQRLELLPQVAGDLRCVTGAGAPRVSELAVLVIAEDERADRALEMGRILVAHDDEFLVGVDLRLDPVVATAGAVGRIVPLRDHTLDLQIARMLHH